jgi:hypothetical protein
MLLVQKHIEIRKIIISLPSYCLTQILCFLCHLSTFILMLPVSNKTVKQITSISFKWNAFKHRAVNCWVHENYHSVTMALHTISCLKCVPTHASVRACARAFVHVCMSIKQEHILWKCCTWNCSITYIYFGLKFVNKGKSGKENAVIFWDMTPCNVIGNASILRTVSIFTVVNMG